MDSKAEKMSLRVQGCERGCSWRWGRYMLIGGRNFNVEPMTAFKGRIRLPPSMRKPISAPANARGAMHLQSAICNLQSAMCSCANRY